MTIPGAVMIRFLHYTSLIFLPRFFKALANMQCRKGADAALVPYRRCMDLLALYVPTLLALRATRLALYGPFGAAAEQT